MELSELGFPGPGSTRDDNCENINTCRGEEWDLDGFCRRLMVGQTGTGCFRFGIFRKADEILGTLKSCRRCLMTMLTPAPGGEKIFEGTIDGGCGVRSGALSPR